MKTALIGYTGFVGGTLCRQANFNDLYRSTNIQEIQGREYRLLICAGAPAAKWIANREPDEDWRNLQALIENLKQVEVERFLLISTVDVYPHPVQVDEDTPIDPAELQPYGKHRFYLEQFVRQHFPRCNVVRLPGLFGVGLKKNFIYDLLNNNALDWTHRDSQFQLYDMRRLWADLQRILEHDPDLINLACEPVIAREIARRCFKVKFDNVTQRPPANYAMWSKYAHWWSAQDRYMYTAEQTYRGISTFIQEVNQES